MVSTKTTKMNQELTTVLKDYINAWNELNFKVIQSLWHKEEEEIYYLAEEMEHPFYSLVEVVNYWNYVAQVLKWIHITTTNIRSKTLTDGLATMSYTMHADFGTAGPEKFGHKPLGVDVRVSTILRNTTKGWRFIHYAESPLGALPFIRRVYHTNVKTKK